MFTVNSHTKKYNLIPLDGVNILLLELVMLNCYILNGS